MDITFRDATDALGVPLEVIAEAIDRSYATVAAYRTGRVQPPAEVWRSLATFAREHVTDVRETAREIAAVATAAEREERQRQ